MQRGSRAGAGFIGACRGRGSGGGGGGGGCRGAGDGCREVVRRT